MPPILASRSPVSFRVTKLFLAACLLAGCNPADPEDSAESPDFRAFQGASARGDYAEALVLAEAQRDQFPDSAASWIAVGWAHFETR